MDAINNKSALLAWLLGLLVITSLYLTVMATTSIIFALAMTLFNKAPLRQRYVVNAMVLIIGSGYLTFAALLTLYKDAWILLLAILIPILVSLLAFRYVGVLQVAVRKATWRAKKNTESRASFEFALTLFVAMTAVCGIFPFQLLQVGNGINVDNKFYTTLVIFIAMMLPLTPVYVFYRMRRSLLTRYASALFAVVIQLVFLMLIAPGLLGSITYAAAGGLDIRQSGPREWLLQDPLAPEMMNQKSWDWISPASGVIRVRAIQLYTFGDVLLLCPPSLTGLPLKSWPLVSAQCVKTKVTTSRMVPEEAPPLPPTKGK